MRQRGGPRVHGGPATRRKTAKLLAGLDLVRQLLHQTQEHGVSSGHEIRLNQLIDAEEGDDHANTEHLLVIGAFLPQGGLAVITAGNLRKVWRGDALGRASLSERLCLTQRESPRFLALRRPSNKQVDPLGMRFLPVGTRDVPPNHLCQLRSRRDTSLCLQRLQPKLQLQLDLQPARIADLHALYSLRVLLLHASLHGLRVRGEAHAPGARGAFLHGVHQIHLGILQVLFIEGVDIADTLDLHKDGQYVTL
mmetsp:Transcript_120190/g.285588  ORF Transcript_120190/g.285588 Transcript_120190/m.285588 type:complete len:251 (+) Transcript_120190:170-922(+)